MRRLLASVVLLAAGTTPVGGASASSVALGFYECYEVSVVVPPVDDPKIRFCPPPVPPPAP